MVLSSVHVQDCAFPNIHFYVHYTMLNVVIQVEANILVK